MRTLKIIAALVAVGALTATASATLMFSVEGPGGATNMNVTPGQTVTLYFYGVIQGADSNYTNEGLQAITSSFKSTGDLKVNYTATALEENFKATGWQVGAANTTIDGDGDIDWGSSNNNDAAGWLAGRNTSFVYGNTNPAKILVATLTTTVNPAGVAGQSALMEPIPRVYSNTDKWKEDGVYKTYTGSGSVGTEGVMLHLIPEPATMALLAIGGLGVLLRRRNRTT